MKNKFEVSFEGKTNISPCYVYISPSENYSGHFNVGILYVKSSSNISGSTPGRSHEFDLKQNLVKSEQEAIEWATIWLTEKSQLQATLNHLEN